MSSKRTLIVRSLSQGEIGVSNEVLPIQLHQIATRKESVRSQSMTFKVLASEKKNQPRRAVVFTIGWPEREMTHAQLSSMKKPRGRY
ncbi:hypothetical protein NC651_020861 [Populus alba x Populus x berolinensis]|nr:hypothetical protein NC651_020861 [Populus alba x Populus x berolinensis]